MWKDDQSGTEEMKDNKIAYLIYESAMSRMERANKRNFIIILLLVALLFGTNIAWVIYESQFEDTVQAVLIESEQDGDYNSVVGGDYYGTSEGYSCQGDEGQDQESGE